MFSARPNAPSGLGLSINTTAANSAPVTNLAVPMFGSVASGAAKPSMFSTTGPPASTSIFPPTNTSTSGSMFGGLGSTLPSTSTATTTQSFFPAVVPATTSNYTSPFGTTTSNQPQTNPIFGSAQAIQKPSTTLFGALGNSSQPQPQSSLFGGSKPTNLFGGPQQSSTSTNIFGLPKPQAQPNPQPNVFGGSTLSLGQSTAQRGTSIEPTNTVPGVRIDMNNVRPTTRFHDLEPELSKAISTMDDNIQNYQRQSAETSQLYNSMIPLTDSIAPDVDYISQKLTNAELALENDAAAIHSVRQIVRRDAAEARVSFRTIDALKLPEQFRAVDERDSRDIFNLSAYGVQRLPQSRSVNLPPSTALDSAVFFDPSDPAQPQDVIDLFSMRTREMGNQLYLFMEQMQAIELHLRGVEADLAQQSRDLAVNGGRKPDEKETVRQVIGALREVDGGIKNVAVRVEEVREQVRDVRGVGVDGIERMFQDSIRARRW